MLRGQQTGSDGNVASAFRPWVHASVADDDVLATRHGALIQSHVSGGLIAAAIFAGYFVFIGAHMLAVIAAGVFIVVPLAIAALLSRTGRLDVAHLLSSAQLTVLIVLGAALSGGSSSFAVAWLVIVPLEAALSGRARITATGVVFALVALVGLEIATASAMLPVVAVSSAALGRLAVIAQIGAVAYAGIVAAGIVRIQRSAQRELEASYERYRLIAENANDLITRHDAQGRTTFASLASITILGLEPRRLIQRGFADVLSPEDRGRWRLSLRRSLETGKPVCEDYLIETPATGTRAASRVWLEMRCQAVPRPPGSNGQSIIAVTRDVTARKAEAIELAQARDDAQTASRAKTAFLATISHELRTPLNSIIGFSQLLQRALQRENRADQLADHCRVIHESGEHLFSLVQDLLDVSKIESGKFPIDPEAFAIDDMARITVEALQTLAHSKQITIDVVIAPQLPNLFADRRATRQILTNLVSNAVKFTPANGRVTLSAQRIADTIEIAVTDTGIGVAPEHIARIGQPFYQVDTGYARRSDGAGLGLSIVRGLVELHGGALHIESEHNRGSKFSVTLPADVDAPVAAPVHRPTAPRLDVVDLAELHRERLRRLGTEADTSFGSANPTDPIATTK